MPDEARNLLCERRYRPLAVLSQAGAPLSWTSERADTSFVCERVRKAAASRRQPQERSENMHSVRRTSFLSANDDEVGESIA